MGGMVTAPSMVGSSEDEGREDGQPVMVRTKDKSSMTAATALNRKRMLGRFFMALGSHLSHGESSFAWRKYVHVAKVRSRGESTFTWRKYVHVVKAPFLRNWGRFGRETAKRF